MVEAGGLAIDQSINSKACLSNSRKLTIVICHSVLFGILLVISMSSDNYAEAATPSTWVDGGVKITPHANIIRQGENNNQPQAHPAIDIAVKDANGVQKDGAKVKAGCEGEVVKVYAFKGGKHHNKLALESGFNPQDSLGDNNTVVIKCTKGEFAGKFLVFGHLKEINVKEGEKVIAKTVVGKIGGHGKKSSDSFPPHLHLELRTMDADNPITAADERLWDAQDEARVVLGSFDNSEDPLPGVSAEGATEVRVQSGGGSIGSAPDLTRFDYTVSNDPDSEGPVSYFRLRYEPFFPYVNVQAPSGWSHSSYSDSPHAIEWFTNDPDSFINAGESLSGFSFEAPTGRMAAGQVFWSVGDDSGYQAVETPNFAIPGALAEPGLVVGPIEAILEPPLTTFIVQAFSPTGKPLTYLWSNTNTCGTFTQGGAGEENTAVWSHPHSPDGAPGTCPEIDVFHPGIITVVVSDGEQIVTRFYPFGSLGGIGPLPSDRVLLVPSTGGENVDIRTRGGFASAGAVAEASLPTSGKPQNVLFPFGFFSYTITDLSVRQDITNGFIFPQDMPPTVQFWSVINGQWVNLTNTMISNDVDNILIGAFCDGCAEDRDGVANGQIRILGGPGIVDTDGDGLFDDSDNCIFIQNQNQSNIDNDFYGDLCDIDTDGDGLSNDEEALIGSNPLIPDTDLDGFDDGEDGCVMLPETVNGFEDDDGCPDSPPQPGDFDGDGIPDEVDKCLTLRETFNGFEDEDGCPDEAPPPTELDPSITFYQITYDNGTAEYLSDQGIIIVDVQRFMANQSIDNGYLNVYDSDEWLVKNLHISIDFPYSNISSLFTLDVEPGQELDEVKYFVVYDEEISIDRPEINDTDFINVTISDMDLSIGGCFEEDGKIPPPRSDADITFATTGNDTEVDQSDHPDVEAAESQCAPASVANSLQYMENRFGLNVPHDNVPGVGSDLENALVSWLDFYMERPNENRTSGEGTPERNIIEGKLKYLIANGLEGNVTTYHLHFGGAFQDDLGDEDITVEFEGKTLTSKGRGDSITIDDIIRAINNGRDVELAYRWDAWTDSNGDQHKAGAHAVEVIGYGFAGGQFYIKHLSDLFQADDTFGTGLVQRDFVVDTNGDSILEFATRFGETGRSIIIDFMMVEYVNDSDPVTRNITLPAAVPSGEAGFGSTFTLTIEDEDLGGFSDSDSILEELLPEDEKPFDVEFPFGFTSFTIEDILHGQQVRLNVTYDENVINDLDIDGVEHWEINENLWVNSSNLVSGVQNVNNTFKLILTDGGPGDGDGAANGEIRYLGGVGFPVTLPPLQFDGITFYQITYDNSSASYLSNQGMIIVDVQKFMANQTINDGYLNVYDPDEWLVKNLHISDTFPYANISSRFTLEVDPGQELEEEMIHLEYTDDIAVDRPDINASDFILLTITDIDLNEGGCFEDDVGKIPPPRNDADIVFVITGSDIEIDQTDHPNLEQAVNQCSPSAVANSLQYLENRFKLNVPHDNVPGVGSDLGDALVSRLDFYMERPNENRTIGEGAIDPKIVEGKLKYLIANGLAENVTTYHFGFSDLLVDDIGDEDITVEFEGKSLTSRGRGDSITIEDIIRAIDNGRDVELGFRWEAWTDSNGTKHEAGAHAVEVIGYGFAGGQFYIKHVSDQVQGNDSFGTGWVQRDFVVDSDGDGTLEFPTKEGLGHFMIDFMMVEYVNNSDPVKKSLTLPAAVPPEAPGAGTSITITVTDPDGNLGGFSDAETIQEDLLPEEGRPPNVVFPFGFTSFKIEDIRVGEQVKVNVTLDEEVIRNLNFSSVQYWKIIDGIWVDLSIVMRSLDNNTFELTLTDGALGDADGVANAKILDPGGIGFILTPQPPETPTIEDLITQIQDMELEKGTEESLLAELKNVDKLLNDDNPNNDSAICGKLDAFLNKVNARAGKSLTEEQAEELRQTTAAIRDSIGC